METSIHFFTQIFLSESIKPRSIWYIASSKGPLPKLFKLYHLGENWPAPGLTILHWIVKGKLQTTFFLKPLIGIWPNSKKNGPRVVPYQKCSNGYDWLHKLVTVSKNRFLKCKIYIMSDFYFVYIYTVYIMYLVYKSCSPWLEEIKEYI